jgi:hypothetical protein
MKRDPDEALDRPGEAATPDLAGEDTRAAAPKVFILEGGLEALAAQLAKMLPAVETDEESPDLNAYRSRPLQ